jgi:hypothetical protein
LVLKTWVCDYFAQDFEENPQLTNRLHKFVFLRVSKARRSHHTPVPPHIHDEWRAHVV